MDRATDREMRKSYNQGVACCSKGDYASAKTHFEECLARLERGGAQVTVEFGEALMALRNAVSKLGSPTEALACSERALSVFRAAGAPAQTIGRAEERVASDLNELLRFAEAIAHYVAAYTAFMEAKEHVLAAQPMIHAVSIYLLQHEFDTAIATLALAEAQLKLAPRSAAGLNEAWLAYWGGMVGCLLSQRRNAEALDCAMKRLVLAETLYGTKHIEVAHALVLIADLEIAVKRTAAALAHAKRAVDMFERRERNSKNHGHAMRILGDVYAEATQWASALEVYERCLPVRLPHEDHIWTQTFQSGVPYHGS